MDTPFRGGRNQRYVIIAGQIVIADMAAGDVTPVVRAEYGDTAMAPSGATYLDESGIELASWTDPRIAPVNGYDIEIIAQDGTGFWYRVTRWESGEFGYDYGYGDAEADFVWDWSVRGDVA